MDKQRKKELREQSRREEGRVGHVLQETWRLIEKARMYVRAGEPKRAYTVYSSALELYEPYHGICREQFPAKHDPLQSMYELGIDIQRLFEEIKA